jgi:hypothetical protein
MNACTLLNNAHETLTMIDAVLAKAATHNNLYSPGQLSAFQSLREHFVTRLVAAEAYGEMPAVSH